MVATSPVHPEPEPLHQEDVVLLDGALHVRHLVETDADVLRVLRESDDPLEATRQCLRIGARAVLAAHVSVDTDIVEKRFDAMSDRFDERVEQAVTQISEVTESLLDEEGGSLPHALQAHRQELDELLGATFDPDSKRSVISVLENVLEEAHEQQVHAIRKLVSVDGDDSPLAQVRRDIVHDLCERLGEVRKDVQEMSEKIAVQEAVAPVLERSTGKGFTFEEVVHDRVCAVASAHGDVADRCGTETGVSGTCKGDEVVTLNYDDTHGLEGRFVLEAKSRKLSMRKSLEELDDALENRDAYAAIAVFSAPEQAPTSVPFHYAGNKAIVVLDKDGIDDASLRLAYMWARWVVRRDLAGAATDELDLARVAVLIDDARRAIERCTTIKRYHSTALRSIKQAGDELGALADEVNDALDAVADELSEELCEELAE